jgi:ethanolamine utilization protein EutA
VTKALHPDELDAGGRIHFSGADRSLIEEDQIELTSVGVDIGSSTSHLLVSTITLERMDTRYVVTDRKVRFQSEILLTPYAEGNTIDANILSAFIADQYKAAGLAASDIDTGALILTGVAARRSNARAIGEIFAAEAGKFVSMSAGDALETLMAAHGSGAVALSERLGTVLNIDVGGGTTKIALCRDGEIVARTAVDAGARLIVVSADNCIERLEPYGARHLGAIGHLGCDGDLLGSDAREKVARHMAETIMTVARGGVAEGFMRLGALADVQVVKHVVFSGGVSEYLSGAGGDAGDIGRDLARQLSILTKSYGMEVLPARQGIRATVVGASQYTVQVSGSTIYLDPEGCLPLRNLSVIVPDFDLPDEIDAKAVAAVLGDTLSKFDLQDGEAPVAVALSWRGTASYARLAALGRGLVAGLAPVLAKGHPLVIVSDGDIGGLIGMQCRSEENVPGAIVSIDGISLSEFDFIDIGGVLRSTGAAPVVVKSLLFPTE